MFGNYPVYAAEKVAQLTAKGNLTPFQQQKLNFYEDVVVEESARIDRDYPGGTTFDFADYEQDTGYGSDTGGTFGSSTNDASTFSDYS